MAWASYNTLRSKEATKSAGFLDKRSRIGFRRDGTEFEKLKGVDMENRRRQVYERDGGKCQGCGEKLFFGQGSARSMEMDHILPRGKGGDDSLDNLQSLCGPWLNRCHSKKHLRG